MTGNPVSERDLLYLLLLVPGLGRKRIRAIYEAYGSFYAAIEEWPDLVERWKLAEAWSKFVKNEKPLTVAAALAQKRKSAGVEYVCFLDAAFPDRMQHIPDPPLALFYRGDLSLLQEPLAIGVVGSRKPTAYGRAVCARLSQELAVAGVVIVSGLAYGIDAEAHQAALKAGGKTIGVMGCGIDQIYPASHRQLYRKLEEAGLLLSEYPPGTPAMPGLFPERNRIISGLSLGVLVVEAAERSGSLITADCALEQGKDVFAVPGPIFSELSAGPHNLLKQGAKMVTTSVDVLEEWEHLIGRDIGRYNIEETRIVSMTPAERAVYDLITEEGVHTDVLLRSTAPGRLALLHQTLLVLEGKGLIVSQPGGYFARR
ncbi:DNA-processing protein DprA [Brevibacillus sp. TJ4]|uniref:DNA-processing protein DprA n=1 Tax=Brevibacillus sp. TJ4 TaxID=3234853 RepID=UPI0037D00669